MASFIVVDQEYLVAGSIGMKPNDCPWSRDRLSSGRRLAGAEKYASSRFVLFFSPVSLVRSQPVGTFRLRDVSKASLGPRFDSPALPPVVLVGPACGCLFYFIYFIYFFFDLHALTCPFFP